MSEALLQKLLDQVQGVQASIDSRLAAVERKSAEADGLAGTVTALRQSVNELKSVALSGTVPTVHSLAKRYGFANERDAENFGLYVLGVVAGRGKALDLLGQRSKALAEGVNATGGSVVPEEFMSTIITLLGRYGRFRAAARVVPMAGDRQVWPKLDSDMSIYAPGEAGAITPSNPTFSNVSLVATKLAGLCALSSELEEDAAVAIGLIVGDSLARSMARREDECGFLGDGTTTYHGMVGIAGALRAVDATITNIKSIIVGSGNAYSELTLGDFDKVVANYPDQFDVEGEVKWYCNRYFFWTVMRPLIMSYSSGKPTIGEPLDVAQGGPRTFLGYPVEFTNVMPKAEANSQICAVLANLNVGAYLGERRQLRIERSRDAYFTTDQIGIRGTERIAVNVFGTGDTTDAGPVMGLITAAS